MPLEGLDLLEIGLFFVFEFFDSELPSVELFFESLSLDVDALSVRTHAMQALLESFILKASIPIVSEYVLLLHLARPQSLLRMSLPLHQLLRLLPQLLVCHSRFGELRAHVLVLPGQRLDVLQQLLRFLSLDLRHLGLLFQGAAHGLVLGSEGLNLQFAFVEPLDKGLFFGAHGGKVVLDVGEVAHLFVQLHFGLCEFLGFNVKLTLEFVNGAVQGLDGLAQVLDLLLSQHKLLLKGAHVLHKHGASLFFSHFLLVGALQALN